jgi:hypothetical protein
VGDGGYPGGSDRELLEEHQFVHIDFRDHHLWATGAFDRSVRLPTGRIGRRFWRGTLAKNPRSMKSIPPSGLMNARRSYGALRNATRGALGINTQLQNVAGAL